MNIEECNPGRDCAQNNQVDCCRTCLCKRPKSPKDINTECIFVEKVFDGRIAKGEFEVRVGFNIPVEPNIISVETINIECKVLSLTTSIGEVSINGFGIDADTTIPGPGGDQVVLDQEEIKNILDNKICRKKGEGTKVQLNQRLRIDFLLEITVTGTGLNTNGQLVDYMGSITDTVAIEPVLGYKACIPLTSLFPVSMVTSCLATCSYALLDFTLTVNDQAQIITQGSTIFCVICDTKIKEPTQLCVLTTGPCRIKKEGGFCKKNDFPLLLDDLEEEN